MTVLWALAPMVAAALNTGLSPVPLNTDGVSVIVKVATVPWSQYFQQSFYHMSLLPLMLMTIVFAWMARPSTQEEIPEGFRQFQRVFLPVWSICVAADWLQGPYVYALYAAYGFSSHEIAKLFVAGFAASLVASCFVGSLADRFGRKKMCLAYCAFSIISCCMKHFNVYAMLMVGRILGGIATSILFSCFECWLVSEHCTRHKFSSGLLSYMFGLMYTCMYGVAIIAGLGAQLAADAFTLHPVSEAYSFYAGGYCSPFDLSIICLLIGMALIAVLWEDNYGSGEGVYEAGFFENFTSAGKLLASDMNVLLLCFVVACFEGSMYAFVFNWTPTLDSQPLRPPHGMIFSLFMMACMCGASVATIAGNSLSHRARLMSTFIIGIVAFAVLSIFVDTKNGVGICFAAFLMFEFCCGLYWPSVSVLKSEVVPERIRGTMYNIFRIPLNAVLIGLLLSNITIHKCFTLCASLVTVALVSIIGIRVMPASKNEDASAAA